MSKSEPQEIVGQLRRALLDEVNNQTDWRKRKAQEPPYDRRSADTAEALMIFAAELDNIPPEDDLWHRYSRVWHVLGGSGTQQAVDRWHEEFHLFDWGDYPVCLNTDAEDVLRLHVEMLEELAAQGVCPTRS